MLWYNERARSFWRWLSFEGVVPMEIGAQSIERRCLLWKYKAPELMLSFGSLLISLLTLIVLITKITQKNNRSTLASCGYFSTNMSHRSTACMSPVYAGLFLHLHYNKGSSKRAIFSLASRFLGRSPLAPQKITQKNNR